MKRILVALVLALSTATLPACEAIFSKPTKMAAGELYESGDAKYDAYFKKVHDEQVAAGKWADDSKAARKSITTALDLPETASNSTILSAAKKKKDDAAVRSAAGATMAAELSFAKAQERNADRLDQLVVQGAELKKQAVEERRNMAADKADPEKVDKKDEVKRELSAAADVAEDLRDDAKKGAEQANGLAKGLEEALGVSASAPPPKKDEPAPAPPKKDEPPPKKPAAKKPPGPQSDKPKPPPQKQSEEIFNP